MLYLKKFLSRVNFVLGLNLSRTTMGLLKGAKYSSYHAICKLFSVNVVGGARSQIRSSFKERGYFHRTSEASNATAKSVKKLLDDLGDVEQIWNDEGKFKYNIWEMSSDLREFYNNELRFVFEEALGCKGNVFYATLYKSTYRKNASGSQLWHSDGGPGTCLNALFYITDTSNDNGAMEIIDWRSSKKLISDFRKVQLEKHKTPPKSVLRDIRHKFYDEAVQEMEIRIDQPTGDEGLLLGFSNNCIHKGGLPKQGHHRIAIVFHVYPSMKDQDFNLENFVKTKPYPSSPIF